MLRNVDKDQIHTLDDLKGIICEQFGDVVSQDLKFDCGYYRNKKRYGSRMMMIFKRSFDYLAPGRMQLFGVWGYLVRVMI